MKIIKFLLVITINIALVWALNTRIAPLPPLGKFLDPFQGFWQNAEATQAQAPTSVDLEGLKSEVQVEYDDLLIPHIFTENDQDLYFMQGYVTAVHRLWQMEFQTHVASGRLSEIIGENNTVLNMDRSQRRKGMIYAAELFLQQIEQDEVMHDIVQSYTAGVNAYISQLEYKDFPIEYKLLDYSPEKWAMLKCALLLKFMVNNLTYNDQDLECTNALKKYGKNMFALLYPDKYAGQEPIVDQLTEWDFEPISIDTNEMILPKEFVDVIPTEKENPLNGSNNWAVSGNKTASGHAILCDDPHLGLNLPSIWYAIQLTSPNSHVKGVSLPGAPAIIVGFNDSIAWGVTNAQRDLVDWYQVEFKDASKKEYKLDGKWKESTHRIEEIKIRGTASFYDTVYYTYWGPVVHDNTFNTKDPDLNLALRWIGHEPSQEVKAFHLINRAKNYEEFKAGLKFFSAPAQNFAFASVKNNIAIHTQGKYPLRWKNQGRFLMDGTKSSQNWQGFIPPEQNTYALNPERGFISSANQHPVDSTYPYYFYDFNYEYYRNRRINQVLTHLKNITPKDMMRLQNDNYNLMAEESLIFFFNQLDRTSFNEEEVKAYEVLKSWKLFNEPEQMAPAYYEAWTYELIKHTWDEMDSSEIALPKPLRFNLIQLLRSHPNLEFWDILSTEEREDAKMLVSIAFKKAVERIVQWKERHPEEALTWANYKRTYAMHLARIAPFSKFNIQIGGNYSIVNATSKNHGPSWRMIVELDPKGVKAWGLYPGGQSGNPGSPFYDIMIDKWAKGEYYSVDLRKKGVQTAFIHQSYQ